MKMTFFSIQYEKDDFSDTITISRHSENFTTKGYECIPDSYSCIASVFDHCLNKYFISTDIECNGGHRYNNVFGDKSLFEKMFKEVFAQ